MINQRPTKCVVYFHNNSNKNNTRNHKIKKINTGRKTSIWTDLKTNLGNCAQDNLDMAVQRKPKEKN